MASGQRIVVDFPRAGEAGAIKAMQDSWVGARGGGEGFLLCPEPIERIESMIRSGNILVARRGEEIVSYLTFYRRREWEAIHPRYARQLDYLGPEAAGGLHDQDYVLIDQIARSRSYRGDAATRLVFRLKRLAGAWGVGHLIGEISPRNRRSAAFFTSVLGAVRIASTTRSGLDWDVYTARIDVGDRFDG